MKKHVTISCKGILWWLYTLTFLWLKAYALGLDFPKVRAVVQMFHALMCHAWVPNNGSCISHA